MNIQQSSIKKILIIKPRGIGDVVLSTILLDNYKAHFKNATIDYLTEPFAKPAVEHLPDVNKVLTMKRDEFPLKAALTVRKEKYDLLIDSWVNPRTALITFLSGVKYRVGFAYRGRKYAYNILATSERG
ncbi:MAG: glycosyltransferase family 9 protein, partial [Ignavibacteria bacterium]|nr:glycosyltransferase family 9 protein [Ignavibacteria bacterium]